MKKHVITCLRAHNCQAWTSVKVKKNRRRTKCAAGALGVNNLVTFMEGCLETAGYNDQAKYKLPVHNTMCFGGKVNLLSPLQNGDAKP